MKILVFGGTRFFGKKLVERLVSEGHDVTIGTRGKTEDNFGDTVKLTPSLNKISNLAFSETASVTNLK